MYTKQATKLSNPDIPDTKDATVRLLLPAGRRANDIYRAIEQAVIKGQLAAGTRLPTVRALAEGLSINKNTVAAAYKMLLETGVIVTDGRRGSVVAGRLTSAAPSPAPAGHAAVALHHGSPDPGFLPTRPELLAAFAALDLTPRLYGEARTAPVLRDWATAAFAADDLAGAGIFVSGGALDAIERALRTHLKPGDKVALEDPGYVTTLALVRSLGLRPVALALDDEGIVPASLAAALAGGCRAVVFSSRAQNPTGATTTAPRAAALRPLVAPHPDVLFVDDDHSSLLNLAPYQPWHAGAGRWLTIRSFSKFLGPDLRVAVSTGDATTLGKLDYAQATSMGWVSTLLQGLAVQLLTTPAVRARIAAAGVAYRERFIRLQAGLVALGLAVPGTTGLNLWLPMPHEAAAAQWLLAQGWLVRPGSEFCLRSPAGLRVTSAGLADAQLDQFLAAVRELLGATARTALA